MALRRVAAVGLLAAGSALAGPPNLSAQSITSCPAPAAVNLGANFAAGFPPADGSIANILPGDTAAQALFARITGNATYADALALPPPALQNGAPALGSYNLGADPACWWTASTCVASKRAYIPPDFSACNEPRVWGLTVDDGPVPDHCALYKLFADNNITASLYYIGSNVVNNPGSALEGFKAGHVICVHTWSHHYTTSLTNAQVFAELYYTKLAIKRVTGYTPRCFRPPYGDVDDRVRAIALGLELDVWLWKQDTNDWSADSGTPAATINNNYQQIIQAASGPTGVIVLTHELSIKVTSFFINNFAALSSAFSTAVVSAHVCSNITHPYAEPNAPIWPSFQHYLAGARPNNGQPLTPMTNASAQVYMAGVGASKTGPDFIDLASMSSASAAAAATAVPSSAAVSSSASAAKAIAAAADTTTTSASPLSTGAKVGIIAGSAALGLIVLAALIFFICRRRRSASTAGVDRRASAIYPAPKGGDLQYAEVASTSQFSLAKPGDGLSPGYGTSLLAQQSTDSVDYHWRPPQAAQGAYYGTH